MRGDFIWRGMLWCCALVVLACSAALSADETLPSRISAENVTPPPPSADILTAPQLPIPWSEIPCPVAPSELTTTETPGPPIAAVAERADNFISFFADNVVTDYQNGEPTLTVAEGHVIACYKNVQIQSDRARADYKTNIASFEGNVVFKVDMQEVRGERLQLNMRSREWSFAPASAIIVPAFLRGIICAPLFANARTIGGIRARELSATQAEITSCDLEKPHYELVSKFVIVYPEEKIIFRDVSAYILNRRIFTLPRLVVPIRDIYKNPSLIPTFGNTVEEGAYLKTSFAYMANKSQTGLLLLDLMQRKGIGTGIRHSYKLSGGNGELYAYFIHDNNIDQDTFTGRFSHDQKLGTLRLNLSTDFRSNSYLYAPDSSTWDTRFALTRDRPGANTSLTLTQSINDVFVRTKNLAGVLHHFQLFGANTSLDTRFDYQAFNTDGDTRSRLTSDVLFARREDKFDWNIAATTLTDLSDEAFVGGGLFAGLERLPEVAIMSDTARLGKILPFGIPAQMRLSYGKFAELPGNVETDRTFLDINTPIQRHNVFHTWCLGLGAEFRQYVYSDNTAQYSVDVGAEMRKKIADKSSFALTYRLQQPRGYTPLRYDFIGRYNILNASLDLRETEKFKLSILGGYNFEQKQFPWQDAVLRCSIQPSPSFLLYTATGYDFNLSRWRTLINQIRIRAGEDFKLDIGTRYDPTLKQLATVRALVDTKLGSKMRLQALAGWNGATRGFDYRSVMLTRDLHCWEVSLAYVNQGGFYQNNGIFLNFRIKAFPLFQDYGIGNFGQALDTSVGQVY